MRKALLAKRILAVELHGQPCFPNFFLDKRYDHRLEPYDQFDQKMRAPSRKTSPHLIDVAVRNHRETTK